MDEVRKITPAELRETAERWNREPVDDGQECYLACIRAAHTLEQSTVQEAIRVLTAKLEQALARADLAEIICELANQAFTLGDGKYPYIKPEHAKASVHFGEALAEYRRQKNHRLRPLQQSDLN